MLNLEIESLLLSNFIAVMGVGLGLSYSMSMSFDWNVKLQQAGPVYHCRNVSPHPLVVSFLFFAYFAPKFLFKR